MKIDFLKDLNNKQREAVKNNDSSLLIIAGPCSGKTRTFVARTLYLIAEKNIPSENIIEGKS
jgi:DNA helicase-2/ATP-dependent DNA helicase PcrA